MPETAESPSVETSPTESPELYAVQLSYPTLEESSTTRFLDQKICIPKYEPLGEGFSVGNSTSDSFISPVESTITTTTTSSSSSSSAFPLFASETTEAASAKTEESHPWASGSDFDKPNELALEHYPILGTYEAVEPTGDHSFGDQSAIDFSLYDNFTFHGIADDNLEIFI